MILPDMTYEQMVDVFLQDWQLIRKEDQRYMVTTGYKIVRYKNATYPMQLIHVWTSPKTHQRYFIHEEFAKRSDTYNGNYRLTMKALVQTQYGLEMAHTVYQPEGECVNGLGLIYYRAHLFNRYAERMNLTLRGEDLIRYFIKRNSLMIQEVDFRKGLQGEVMMTCFDGACFGHTDDNRMFNLKTFIASDTMQDGYKAQFNKEYDVSVTDGIKQAYYAGRPDLAYRMAVHVKRRKDGNPSLITK